MIYFYSAIIDNSSEESYGNEIKEIEGTIEFKSIKTIEDGDNLIKEIKTKINKFVSEKQIHILSISKIGE